MLLCGMREIKVYWLIIILIVSIGVVSLLSIYLIDRSSSQPPEQDPSSKDYCRSILSLAETSGNIRVGDVFQFDFDEAYVASEPYGDEDYFKKKLGVNTKIDIFEWETGGHYRILFIKEKCIIYDFVYEIGTLNTPQKGISVYPDSIMTITEEHYDSGHRYVQFIFN